MSVKKGATTSISSVVGCDLQYAYATDAEGK